MFQEPQVSVGEKPRRSSCIANAERQRAGFEIFFIGREKRSNKEFWLRGQGGGRGCGKSGDCMRPSG